MMLFHLPLVLPICKCLELVDIERFNSNSWTLTYTLRLYSLILLKYHRIHKVTWSFEENYVNVEAKSLNWIKSHLTKKPLTSYQISVWVMCYKHNYLLIISFYLLPHKILVGSSKSLCHFPGKLSWLCLEAEKGS